MKMIDKLSSITKYSLFIAEHVDRINTSFIFYRASGIFNIINSE